MIQSKLYFEDGPAGGSKIPVGIHTGNVLFDGLQINDKYADIKFVDTKGRTIHHRLFHPSGSYLRDKETVQDAIKRESDKNLSLLINQTMRRLLGDELVSAVTANNYEEYLPKAAALLESKKGALVNLKVVPDYKENKYPELPLYDYVELNTGEETKLAFTPGQLDAIAKRLGKSKDQEPSMGELV